MRYDFDQVLRRRGGLSSKWNNYEVLRKFGVELRGDDETIPLTTADMDFPVAEPIRSALIDAAKNVETFGYSRPDSEYYPALCAWYRDRYNWEIDPDTVLYDGGTNDSLVRGVRAFTAPGDKVIVTYPVFSPIYMAAQVTGRTVVNSKLSNQGGYYTMDFADIEAKAKDPLAKMFILCNPQNPTGRVWTPEEIKRLSDICVQNGLVLVSDEVHGDITRVGITYTPALTVADPDNTVAYISLNKTFSIAGLQSSHAVIPNRELRQKYSTENMFQLYNVFGIAATKAAYKEGGEWLEQARFYIDDNFDWAVAYLRANLPKVKVWKPEGTYFLWMDFSAYGLDNKALHYKTAVEANVLLQDGDGFDPEMKAPFLRMCMCAPRKLLEEAMGRICGVFQSL